MIAGNVPYNVGDFNDCCRKTGGINMAGDDIRSPFDEDENQKSNPNVGFKVSPVDLGATLAKTRRTHPWEDTKQQYRMVGWGGA